jgi:hypothetical protein
LNTQALRADPLVIVDARYGFAQRQLRQQAGPAASIRGATFAPDSVRTVQTLRPYRSAL